jgi:hypothetical protein
MPASRPTLPNDSQPRRLGVGGSSGGGDRFVRVQLIIAVVSGFSILAVLLYLLRRPTGVEHTGADEPTEPSASASAAPPATVVRTKVETPEKAPARVKVGTVQRQRCGSSPKNLASEPGLCDSLPFFEQALVKAVLENPDCAPKQKEEGTISYALSIDFRNHETKLYPGKSGSWRGPQAKKATDCVKRAIPAPTWDTMGHQYRYYLISLVATYPAESTTADLPDFK